MTHEPPKPTDAEKTKDSEESKDSAFPKPPQSAAEASQWLVETEKFVRLVADNLRYGSWTKRFAIAGGIALFALNPGTAGKVADTLGLKLPENYPGMFLLGIGGLATGAVGAAIVTLPKRPVLEPIPERQAIKGLRSFEAKDAEIFTRLERQRDVQECLDALRDPELRLGFLLGESGAGKSSLLQAGVLPRLEGMQGVYVKMSDRAPITLIRTALKADTSEEFVPMLRAAVAQAKQPIALVLDQFEQVFVQFREEERSPFIAALKAWYESDVAVKIWIGIRGDLSDRLVEIQKVLGYSLRPNQVYRLEKFAPAQAVAVLKVMADTEGITFNPSFVAKLARNELAGRDGLISPVDVQILAWMINREAENRAFDETAFLKFGGVDGLLGRFLKRSLDGFVSRAERDRALEVLLALTDLERNVRGKPLSLVELQGLAGKVRGVPSEVEATVRWLVEARLITPVEGGEGYELAHERLIPALRLVANQELTAANRANVLLEQRVNEWLGNGRSGRYLLGLQELWLLRQQRAFLVWGDRQAQKQELLVRSWRQALVNVAGLSFPVMVAAGFGVWSHTPPGQIQWVRWQLMDVDRLVDLERSGSNEETFTALTLDAVASAKGPVPMGQYWGWAAPVSERVSNPLVKLIRVIGDVKDKALAKQLLSQALVVAQANKSSAAKAESLSAIAKSANQLNDSASAKQLLNQVLMSTQSLSVDESSKATILEAITQSANQLNDSAGVKQLLSQVSVEAQAIKDGVSKANVLRSIAESYRQLDDRVSARVLLSQAQQLAQSIPAEDFNKANVLRPSVWPNAATATTKSAFSASTPSSSSPSSKPCGRN